MAELHRQALMRAADEQAERHRQAHIRAAQEAAELWR